MRKKESHGIDDIKRANAAANAEIAKIRKQQTELARTIEQLNVEAVAIERELNTLDERLDGLESELAQLAPTTEGAEQRLDEILTVRDTVRRGLSLVEQRHALLERRDELTNAKPATKADRPQLGPPSTVMHEFAQKVSEVLKAWKFPGECHVAFDEGVYDVRIDGKNRKDNGKGVRAVTHAAFKVALLIFCRERDLPHPGFLVLDTPLLTYRDPLKSPKARWRKTKRRSATPRSSNIFSTTSRSTGSSHNSLLSKTSICPITSLPSRTWRPSRATLTCLGPVFCHPWVS